MAFSATEFREKVRGIARPQYFLVSFPSAFRDEEALSILSSSTSLPSRSVEQTEIPVQGLNIKLGGNVTYDNWTVTFRAEKLHRIRNTFLKWNSLVVNSLTMERSLPEVYKHDNVYVAQLDDKGNIVTSVKFYGLWPADVGEITLGHDEEPPEEFDVEFAYDLWQMSDPQADWNISVDISLEDGGVMVGTDVSADISTDIGSADISLGGGIEL